MSRFNLSFTMVKFLTELLYNVKQSKVSQIKHDTDYVHFKMPDLRGKSIGFGPVITIRI